MPDFVCGTSQQVRFIRSIGSICVLLGLVIFLVLVDVLVGVGSGKARKSSFTNTLRVL